ncbi:MAG: VPLPA-CTERM sorting domain-containing protein [Pseudomonadota bacterium]
MSIIGCCRSVVLASVMAVSGAAVHAATVATIDINGDFNLSPLISVGPFDIGTDLEVSDGEFDFQLLGPVDQPGNFIYGASLSVNGQEVFAGSIDGPVGVSPLDFGGALLGFLPTGIISVAEDFASALANTGSFSASSFLGSVEATVSDLSVGSDSITGDFTLDASSLFVPSSSLLLGSAAGGGSSASGDFLLSLSITSEDQELGVVPLPASAWFLLAAMGGLFGFRRWKAAA